MIASVSEGTIKQYNKPLRLWWTFCQEKGISVFEADSKSVLEFLVQIYQQVGSYGTLNSYRSAISLILMSDIGNDPVMKRFFKGVSSLKPQRPRYDFTWDPQVVIELLKSWHPHENLSLKQLSGKLLMLMALITSQRMQTMSKISLDNIVVSTDFVQIKIADRIKTSKVSQNQPCLLLPFFREQPELCVASLLIKYLERTLEMRNSVKNLFITFKKPVRPATTQTLSNWIKYVLNESGVDTSIFKSHSTRHASTSAAKLKGIDIETIRRTAGWSERSKTFATFYKRPMIDKSFYARAVIDAPK